MVLSDHMKDGKRVHSVVKQFKKYATQNAVQTFKNQKKKEWGFTIVVAGGAHPLNSMAF